MEYGRHCKLAECNALNFLPFHCHWCGEDFCDQHRFPDAHQCASVPASVVGGGRGGVSEGEGKAEEGGSGGFRCVYVEEKRGAGCDALTEANYRTVGVVCSGCGGLYCLGHRSVRVHGCAGVTGEQLKEIQAGDSAREELLKAFRQSQQTAGGKDASGIGKSTKKKKKMHPKVAAMKIKANALGDPKKISESQKRYLLVRVAGFPETSNDPFPIICNSTHKVGQLIDQICKLQGITFSISSPSPKLLNGFTGEVLDPSCVITSFDLHDPDMKKEERELPIMRPLLGRVVLLPSGTEEDHYGGKKEEYFPVGAPYVW
eukprot:Nk52_evm14s249 gene=Nk52_evmTU14s249